MTLKGNGLAMGIGGMVLALLILWAGISALKADGGTVGNGQPQDEPTFGGAAGPTHTDRQDFLGGVLNAGTIATTTNGAQTVTAAQLRQWVNASLIQISPVTVAGSALTLPASSTIPDLVPRTGERQEFCMINSTSTANVPITLVSGIGTRIHTSSSSVSAVGGVLLKPGAYGCGKIVREHSTTTAHDIGFLFEVFY